MPALHLTAPAAASRLARARGAVATFCEELRVEPATIERVQAAVTEACANCIQHAYSGDSEADTFTIDATTADGELVICVIDCGRGIDDVEERRLDGGFGLEIIEGLADAHEIRKLDRGGTCVVLRFDLP
jgi:anti-sigma regulatory factor (Ser/Thr protein kinase)